MDPTDHPTQALLIIDHGSRRAEAHAALVEIGERVRAMAGPGALVVIAHMEIASPDVAAGVAQCVAAGATEIVAVPYLLAAGRHATEDIPRLVAEAVSAHPGVSARVTAPLGPDELLARLVLKRAGAELG